MFLAIGLILLGVSALGAVVWGKMLLDHMTRKKIMDRLLGPPDSCSSVRFR